MKAKQRNRADVRALESRSSTTQPAISAVPQESSLRSLRSRRESKGSGFLPIKVPPDWTDEKDKQGFIEIWGEGPDFQSEVQERLEVDVEWVHISLDTGVEYLAKKSNAQLVLPLSTLNLREKVALFTQLLPVSQPRRYTLRFSMLLARILWLESERERIYRDPDSHRWLFPFYTLGDYFLSAACELRKSLECEHKDFCPTISSRSTEDAVEQSHASGQSVRMGSKVEESPEPNKDSDNYGTLRRRLLTRVLGSHTSAGD